jgi:predicted tellurium resistance membrane protein TerC
MSISRLIIGIILLVAGLFFVLLAMLTLWWMVFYGIPFLIIGIVILLNKNEDKIEKRKDLKEKMYKK